MNKADVNHIAINASVIIHHMVAQLERANKVQDIDKQILHLGEIERQAKAARIILKLEQQKTEEKGNA